VRAPQKSLKKWGQQKWRTKSGPAKAIKSLSSSEYAATTRAKRKGKAAGKQHVSQPKKVAKKVRQYRT
jgi:hypothetical protein